LKKKFKKNIDELKISDIEHNTGSDRYLITYADLITLLLGLFVILYAASQVDKTKFSELSAALAQYFNPKTGKILEKGEGELTGGKGVLPAPEFSVNKEKSLQEVRTELEQKLSELISQKKITIAQTGTTITLVLPEVLLFQSGKAQINNDSYPILDSIASILKQLPFEIYIDGHTDIIPIRTFQYESNWHLSVDRALNVGYYLIQKGIVEKNVVIRGFGPERPIDDNSTPEGRSRNRRVEITIAQPTSSSAATTQVEDISSQENIKNN